MASYPEDRRYETFEMRAAYDKRYVVDSRNITSKAAYKAAQAEADRIYCRMGEIRSEARQFDTASDEYRRSVAAFEAYAKQRQDIFRRMAEYEAAR